MKTVLITGSSKGIGKAIAERFSQAGYNVAINYNCSQPEAQNLKKQLINNGKNAEVFKADIVNAGEVNTMLDKVIECFGGIDVLVNNAGVALPQGLFTDFDDKDSRRIFDTNVFGTMNCSRAVIPHFVAKKRGRIINISSIWGVSGGSCEVIYSASKGAIVAFTKALAKELAPSGINVNCIAPGMIDTEMNKHLSKEEIDSFAEDIPCGRIGTPQEIADITLFLAEDSSSYITGQTLVADGGYI
jgi:3-oxoacyl-[acyl-carrier protein] reductase